MEVLRVLSPVVFAVTLLPIAVGAQPQERDPAEAPPPHVIRLDGDAAQLMHDGVSEVLEAGDPVLFGDRVASGNAYIQVLWPDGARMALDRGTTLDALSPELVALTDGRAIVSRPAAAAQPLRLDTPAASLMLAADGEYRIQLAGPVTTVAVVRGKVDVQSGMGTMAASAGQQVTVRDGLAPGAPTRFNAAGYDSFVQWASQPLPAPATGAPLETFQDPQFEAYADVFNQYGSWHTDAQYGAVWYPMVGVDWRPYSVGYWHPYGGSSSWLWVGKDPWGWPTHHYGRWDVNPHGRWFWMPGRRWAPAWVGWSVGPGYVGWSPLGRHDRPVTAWDDLARRPGMYTAGTLAPHRAWTVVPSDRFGGREPARAHAVDPRTLDNLSAFVTQRVGPPARYGVPRGTVYGYGSGAAGPYGPGAYYGPPRSGGDTSREIRRGGPTRVGPGTPGYGGPTPTPEDPYERAQRAVVPRSRQRTPAASDAPSTPPAEAAPPATRQRTPPSESPAATDKPAAEQPPPKQSNPPASSGRVGGTTSRSTGESTGRRAVPRP